MNHKEKRFSTSSVLTLATKTIILNEGEKKEEIIEEAMNIIAYIFEDIPNEKTNNLNKNLIASGYIQSRLDPIYVYTLVNEKENFDKKKKDIYKSLGTTICIPKIKNSHIENINSYQKKKS